MGKNLVTQLKTAFDKGYTKGCEDGKDFGLSLCTVALNNLYGFGGKRIAELSAELQRIWEQEFLRDMESASVQLQRRLEQIKSEGQR